MTIGSLLWKFGLMRMDKKKLAPAPLCTHEWSPLCIVFVAAAGKYLHFAPLNGHTYQQLEYCMKLHGFGADGQSKCDWGRAEKV